SSLIYIHPRNFKVWEFLQQPFFNFLCPKISLHKVVIATSRTSRQWRIGSFAIVTHEIIGVLALRQRHIAVLTLWEPHANHTDLVRGVTSPVLKENHLLTSFNGRFYFFN